MQGAAADRGVAGQAVVAGKDQRAAAPFIQLAAAAELAFERAAGVRAANAQGVGGADERDAAAGQPGEAVRAPESQPRTAGDMGRGVVAQCLVALGGQPAGPYVERAAERVLAHQRHVIQTAFRQRAGPGNRTAEGQCIIAGQVQVGIDVDGIAQHHRQGVVEACRARHGQCARAQCAIVTQGQRTGVQRGAALISIVAIERQVRSPVLDQAADAAELAVQGQVIIAEVGQAGVERHVVAQAQCPVIVQGRDAGHREFAQADGLAAADGQDAGIQGDAAQMRVGAVQGQSGRAVFNQAAGAVDRTVQGQVGAAADVQIAAEVDGVAQGDGGVGVQRRVGRRVQRTRAQRGVGADDQFAGIQEGVSEVAV